MAGRRLTVSSSHEWHIPSHSLHQLIAYPPLAEKFHQYLRSNFAEENLFLFVDALKFSRTKFNTQEELITEAQRISDKYLSDPDKIYLSSEIRRDIATRLKDPTNQSYDEVLEDLRNLIECDSLPKFFRSELYADWKAKQPPVEPDIQAFITAATLIAQAWKSFQSKFQSPRKADDFQIRLGDLAFHCFHLFQDGKITRDDLKQIQPAVHHLANLLIDAYEISFTYNPHEIIESISQLQQTIRELWKNKIDAEDINNICDIFNEICNIPMLNSFFTRKKWKETTEIGETLRLLWDDKRI
eukprot:TRINITY_DN10417_c0_g1_i1.p1 TRINITY_DN10417_c0_g1~~TRINITY_DN10417_c0_g1_i1.p1  ORF type:complete len:299 (-),score=52.87 TRINITY_DN10417_c0_g1_i1:113-1009(-)